MVRGAQVLSYYRKRLDLTLTRSCAERGRHESTRAVIPAVRERSNAISKFRVKHVSVSALSCLSIVDPSRQFKAV